MNLKPLGTNRTEVETDRYRVLFSYKTPVAYYDKIHHELHKTTTKWSRTTSKHITQWVTTFGMENERIFETAQDGINDLLSEVK